MRIQEIKLYKFDELNEKAKEAARDWYRRGNADDNYLLDEMLSSLKALFEAAGITLTDWNLGAYSQDNYVQFDMGDASELTGPRALAWLENNLFSALRMTPEQYNQKRKEYLGYGDAYRPGTIKPCPLTGLCYDEDFLDALRKSVKDGETLKEAFKGLAGTLQRLLEAELEYQNEDAQVDESMTINEYEFTEDGEVA